jgi:putative phosphoesterase
VNRKVESKGGIVVGVVSDTHGQLHPWVREMLVGVDHIIHAGDIGSAEVLAGLRAIAPLTAVRGNCDWEAWAWSLPVQAEVELGGVRILVGHVAGRLRETLGSRPVQKAEGDSLARSSDRGFRVVVTGHSHRTESEERNGVLYLNPGSAGPERFGCPRTLARLLITPLKEGEGSTLERAEAQITVELLVVGAGR